MENKPKREYTLAPTERETVVNFNEGEKTCDVYTYNRRWKKKIFELFMADKESVKFRSLNAFKNNEPTLDELADIVEDSQECLDVTIPSWKWIKFRGPSTRKPMTEEQKKAAAERLAAGRAKAKMNSEDDSDSDDDEDDDEGSDPNEE